MQCTRFSNSLLLLLLPHIQAHCILSVALMLQVFSTDEPCKIIVTQFYAFQDGIRISSSSSSSNSIGSIGFLILSSYIGKLCHMPHAKARQGKQRITLSTWQLVMRAQEHSKLPTSQLYFYLPFPIFTPNSIDFSPLVPSACAGAFLLVLSVSAFKCYPKLPF